MKKRVMLYFGSFNPIHRGHISLSEYILDCDLADEVILIVSPHNPLKEKEGLAPEFERFTMAEMAAKESKYPEHIKASVIEFLLEKPSYTINTLTHLHEEYGTQMDFSLLIGADNLAIFDKWKSWQQILDEYPLYVYPRDGYPIEKHLDKIQVLEGAPLQNFSSTEVREALENGGDVTKMLQKSVEEHITKNKIWKVKTSQTDAEKVAALIESGKNHHRHNEWGKALNDFNAAMEIDPSNKEAKEFATIIQEILDYRYTDIYNP